MSLQTLSSGVPTESKYGQWGIANKVMVPGAAATTGLIVGEAGHGKTSLFLDHPGALLINCDLSPTPRSSPDAPAPLCQFWPGILPDGRPCNKDSTPIMDFTWASVEAVVSSLIAAAKANLPRPETIVFDNAGSMLPMLRAHIVQSCGKTSWQELEIRSAWDAVYDRYVTLMKDLHSVGYGVYYIAHLVHKYVQIGENLNVESLDIGLSDKLYMRLVPTIDLFLGIAKTRETVSKEVEKEIALKGGQTLKRKEVVTTQEARVNLVAYSLPLSRVTKARVKLPDIIPLPANGGWRAFTTAYDAAANCPLPTT